jgi:hypothetical protein
VGFVESVQLLSKRKLVSLCMFSQNKNSMKRKSMKTTERVKG